LTGRQDRELEFLRLLLADSRERASLGESEDKLIELTVHCILEAANAERASGLFDALASAGGPAGWQRAALLDALTGYVTAARRYGKPVTLTREPGVLIALARGPDLALRQRA